MEKKKKPLFKRWWFWVLAIVIIGAIGSSGGDKETPKETSSAKQSVNETDTGSDDNKDAEQTIYQIGDSFETGDLDVTVLEVKERTEFKSDNQFIDAVTTQGKFIAVKAKITNNDTKARTLSSAMFKIIDDEGREFETLTNANLMMILGDDNLFLESCNPGMSRTGIFVFEVPEDIGTYSLKVYSGTALAAKTSTIVKLK